MLQRGASPGEGGRAQADAPLCRNQSGPWQTVLLPEHDPGKRLFSNIGTLRTELGQTLDNVVVAYETWGSLNEDRSNAVLILHGFTADSHASGPAGEGHPEPGWWDGVVGPGLGIDTNRFFVVCPNVLGGCQGTTGPGQRADDGRRWGSRWPVLTIRDQVAAEVRLGDDLGIRRWHGVVGPSLGGMRALEWSVSHPERVARAVYLGVGAQASAEQIGLQSAQMLAIVADPMFANGDYYEIGDGRGPTTGMGIARRIGHLSYRSEIELHERFGNRAQPGEEPLSRDRTGRYAIQSYLDYAATRLARRFDPNTYLAINEAMNHHDVGRGRGGVGRALQLVSAKVTVIGLDGDRLYPLRQQEELCASFGEQARMDVVHSSIGHDAFLTEHGQVGVLVEQALAW